MIARACPPGRATRGGPRPGPRGRSAPPWHVLGFVVEPAAAAAWAPLHDVPLPEACRVMLVVRGEVPVSPRADVILAPGDRVYVVSPAGEDGLVHLLLGRRVAV